MWVYQETKTNAAALVPTLPEDTAGESVTEKEAMTPASGRLTEIPLPSYEEKKAAYIKYFGMPAESLTDIPG